MADTIVNSSAGNGNTAVSGSGLLEFEKPLARIEQEIAQLEAQQQTTGRDLSEPIGELRNLLRGMTREIYTKLTAWETVQVARHPRRPIISDYLRFMVKDFVELHGDRTFGDDKAMVCGFGRIAGHKVMLVGHNKGKDTKEKIACHFGCAHPEGYRKSLLKMKLAEKFNLPIVCLIDTQGAYPGIGAEERGISQAIAVNLLEMSRLKCPIVCVVIGEGGSGGALGIGVGDRMALLQHSFYSVISPEGCAAILFKTGEQARRAAESLHLTANELLKLQIIDDIIPEPLGGAHRRPDETIQAVDQYLAKTLRELKRVRIDTLLKRRYNRLRTVGSFFESANKPATPPRIRKPKAQGADRLADAASVDGASKHRRSPAPVAAVESV
ncbi:MAG: Acetyl-coenzyme A carboxylase carboxyl transferase subunit alpha [Phycisphaerae bacterium]|nr:Acetyl-coenzyme A carboxylase carboxyl transferase subunit alpha [Phycisphaerae bacterium]